MSRLTLSTRGAAAVAANFYARDRAAQMAIKRVVRRNGVALHERARALCPVDTGFMRSQLRLAFSEQGYVYEVGWDEQDFSAAGLAFYPVYVEFGTRFQAAQPSLFPAREQQDPIFRRELRAELSAAIQRGRA